MSVKMRVRAVSLKVHVADLQKLRCFLVKSEQVCKSFRIKKKNMNYFYSVSALSYGSSWLMCLQDKLMFKTTSWTQKRHHLSL